ncbi:hypothetical protein FGIG_09542 [Fasciola gigantica]|uniref:Cystatin domain-containing protein n=1 Tax=Fasciola gigantica TaxID=46835 RepID=A0A504YYW8_FASGI|nr:hypothetical protein FGIG_09542 [Fasciola gigantica]
MVSQSGTAPDMHLMYLFISLFYVCLVESHFGAANDDEIQVQSVKPLGEYSPECQPSLEQANNIRSLIQDAVNQNNMSIDSANLSALENLNIGETTVLSISTQVVRGWNHRITIRDSQRSCYRITLYRSPEWAMTSEPLAFVTAEKVTCPGPLSSCLILRRSLGFI